MPYSPSPPAPSSIFSAQQGLLTDLAQRLYSLTGQVAELNLRLMQQLLLDAGIASRQLLAARDPVQAFSISVHAAGPAFEHVRTYQQELAGLLTGLRPGGARAARRQAGAAAGTASAPASYAARADSAAAAAGYGHLH